MNFLEFINSNIKIGDEILLSFNGNNLIQDYVIIKQFWYHNKNNVFIRTNDINDIIREYKNFKIIWNKSAGILDIKSDYGPIHYQHINKIITNEEFDIILI